MEIQEAGGLGGNQGKRQGLGGAAVGRLDREMWAMELLSGECWGWKCALGGAQGVDGFYGGDRGEMVKH